MRYNTIESLTRTEKLSVVGSIWYTQPETKTYKKRRNHAGGFLKADERNRLKSIVSKAIRYGFLPHSFSTLDELREDADEKLFYSSRYNPNHVLHRLLPQPKRNDYNLRQRTHNLTLK